VKKTKRSCEVETEIVYSTIEHEIARAMSSIKIINTEPCKVPFVSIPLRRRRIAAPPIAPPIALFLIELLATNTPNKTRRRGVVITR